MTPAAPNLTGIVVTPPSPFVVAGQSQQFIATGIYNNGSSQDLTQQVAWTSSDPTVATISATGAATSVIEGIVTIVARFNGISGSTTLTVTALALVGIAVIPANLTLVVGQTQQFGAVGTLTDSSQIDVTAEATWSASDPTVASISATGFATALKAGACDILATGGVLAGASPLSVTAATAPPIPVTPPVVPGSPADYLQQAQQAMFQLLAGKQPSRVDTPQLGAVEYVPTTSAQLQRLIDYLQALVQNGNQWPTDGSGGSMSAGYRGGRIPFSFYGWP